VRNKILASRIHVLASVVVFTMWVWGADNFSTSLNGDPRSTLGAILHGTAHRPFVERMLVPILTRGVYALADEERWNDLSRFLLKIPKIQEETTRLGWETQYLPEYIIALGLALGSLIGFAFVFERFYSSLYETYDVVTNALPTLAVLCLPPFFDVGTHYIYDFPSLLLFTMGLLLMQKRKWTLFYPVFIIGCLNKETMVILLVGFVLLFYQRMSRRKMLLHVAAQLGIFAIVKGLAMYQYGANPGSSLEFHLYRNIHFLLLPYNVVTLIVGAVIIGLTVYDIKEKHILLRKMAWLIVPFAALMVVFGLVNEVRALYELFPIYFLLIAHTVLFSFLKLPFKLKLATE